MLAEGLYERLARQWWGPVGWLVAVWAVLTLHSRRRVARECEPE